MNGYIEKYFLKHPVLGEKEVTREEFIAAEREAGYSPKSGNPNDLATGGFGSRFGMTGSIRYVKEGETEVAQEKSKPVDAQVSALDIKPGTLVVLSLNLDTPDNVATAQTMAQQLRHAIPHENKLLVLQRPAEIEALDEAQMRQMGWVKSDALDALERLLKWHNDIYGDDCNYTGDHPLAVAKATIERIKGGA